MQTKTLNLIETVNSILSEYVGPLTLRQLYYRLVAAQVIPNEIRQYKRLSSVLTDARRAGEVDATRIIDRIRQASRVQCWSDLSGFLETVKRSYRREKWSGQRRRVEVWCEKDALAGVLEPVANEFEVTLYPCRGYNSYSALMEAAERIKEQDEGHDTATLILYMGDFDPSGADMSRDIRERLADDFDVDVELRVLALTRAQIQEYNLPHAPTKSGDSRAAAFIARHGDMCVELDALPPDALQDLVRNAIKSEMDLSAFEAERELQDEEQAKLERLIEQIDE